MIPKYHRQGLEAEPTAAGDDGSLGTQPPAAGRFFVMEILMPYGSRFTCFHSHLKEQNFLRFEFFDK